MNSTSSSWTHRPIIPHAPPTLLEELIATELHAGASVRIIGRITKITPFMLTLKDGDHECLVELSLMQSVPYGLNHLIQVIGEILSKSANPHEPSCIVQARIVTSAEGLNLQTYKNGLHLLRNA